jgi:tricorn protease
MHRLARLLALVVVFVLAAPAQAQEETKLLRFPAVHDDKVVFTYAGDLYTVAATGGVARRLTSHDGFEMFARFSPDGKQLAFTGQYDGNTEVYLMPADGGTPKRLTHTATLGRDDVSDRMGPNNIVIGWRNDGKHILFRSRMHSFNDFVGQLFLVSVEGGLPEQLPLPTGGFASYSPDDKKLAYNRIFREFRTWKRYRGGMADDLWLYDFNTKQVENLTKNVESDIIPMWHGNKIYFLSDRDANKRMNLYGYDLTNKTTRQLTEFKDFDVKFPSLGNKAIAFENGGELYLLDLATEKPRKVPVRILQDQVTGRGGMRNVSREVTNFEIAPDGKRALFGARGEVFTVPAARGPTRNLSQTPGVHERNSKWSPDGKWIAYIGDATGEDEIWIMSADGKEGPKQITSGGDVYKYALEWSPDSKKIMWADRKQRLHYVDVESKKAVQVEHAEAWEIRQYVWSPDSRWIAYAKVEKEGMDRVYLYSLEQAKSWAVTDGWFDSNSPAFSGDSKYLFFVSERDFNPIYSQTEWNHAYQDMARIYFVTLAKETENPFKPRSDETGVEPAKPEPTKPGTPIKVDVDGIVQRIHRLPVQPANYGNLHSVGSSLYYVRRSSRSPGTALQLFDLTTQKETALGTVSGFEISADGKKMLISKDGSYGIIDLPKSGTVAIGEALSLTGMEMKLDRHAEWRQIHHECWRQMRDFFFDPNMHGVDWLAVRKKYEPLLAHVNHRADLTYIIGEMIAELNAGHAYVGGGDMPRPERIRTGLLGAELKRDDKTRYYQITKILKGANWNPALRAPLTELGLNVKEGDYIVAVDGKPTNELANVYEALIGKVDRQVTLRINGTPTDKGARDIVVLPIGDEAELYYYNWVQMNIAKVDKATGGKVGYIHIPDMQANGLNEFVKHFYPQLRKKALIIDVRGNGGGNVSPMIIERLRREIAMVDMARNTITRPDPNEIMYGPLVCLMNEYSASDGDLFPYRFRHYKLGTLIGRRSWGGVIGIRGTLPLLDGGTLNKPEFASYDVAGKTWIIEGHGVDPDIVQDNDPAKEFAGVDEQLDKAIAVILEELKTKEKTLPPPPPFPKK